MTVRQNSGELVEARTVVLVADYDEYLDAAYCPLCGADVTNSVGTPEVSAHLLDISVQEDLRVFGWRCDCRRHDLVLPAPAAAAPDSFTPVDATLDGEPTTVAVPEPVLEAALAEAQ